MFNSIWFWIIIGIIVIALAILCAKAGILDDFFDLFDDIGDLF